MRAAQEMDRVFIRAKTFDLDFLAFLDFVGEAYPLGDNGFV